MKRILRTLILVLTAVSLMCSFSFSAYASLADGENPPPESDFDIEDDIRDFTSFWSSEFDQVGEDIYDFLHPSADSEQGQQIKDSYKPEVSSNWKDDDGDGKYDSFTVPENYNLYGKRTLKYPDGSHELFTVHFFYETPTREDVYGPTQPYNGNYIELTRENSAGAKISKQLTIVKLNSVNHDSKRFYFNCTILPPDGKSYTGTFYFTGSAVNDISLVAKSVPSESYWFNSRYVSPTSSNYDYFSYVVSIGSTNNSSFYADVSNIYSVNLFGVCPIIISNVLGGTQIDMNNYMKFGDLGFSFNPDVGLSFDPDIYFDKYYKDFSVDIENLFKRIYSKMPEIGDTFVNSSSDTTYNYFDIFQPEEQPPATTPSGGGGGDVNVNVDVDVTLPPEWLDSYPELDTTPAIDLDSPDYDYFKDNSLTGPPQATSTFLQMALDFIVDNGFLPYLCAIVLLVIFWRLTGGS